MRNGACEAGTLPIDVNSPATLALLWASALWVIANNAHTATAIPDHEGRFTLECRDLVKNKDTFDESMGSFTLSPVAGIGGSIGFNISWTKPI